MESNLQAVPVFEQADHGSIRRHFLKYHILIFLIITATCMVSCAQQDLEGKMNEVLEEQEFQRPGARSGYFVEGPHLIYQEGQAWLLTSEEQDSAMVLKSTPVDLTRTRQIEVVKAGFLPRDFMVTLKTEIVEEPTYFPEADALFAVSDVEGNFNTLVNLLQQHKIINDDLNWIFGTGHFVMVGDVFDRGNHVTEMLWLIYHLEEQAKAAGGYVHFVMGNHEAMNLRGDVRYIEPKYEQFAALTKAEYGLEHGDLFSSETELGRWLRSKNVVEKIGDKLFCHAGLSPELVAQGYTLEMINARSRDMLDVAKADFNEAQKLMWSKQGPFWYRGYFDVNPERWGPRASQTEVAAVLDHYEASTIVVGHTHVTQPELHYQGLVCAIDVVPPADHMIYAPPIQSWGLLIRGKGFYGANGDGGWIDLKAPAEAD